MIKACPPNSRLAATLGLSDVIDGILLLLRTVGNINKNLKGNQCGYRSKDQKTGLVVNLILIVIL